MNVGKAIFNILSTNAAVSEFVGSRIYPEMAPEEVETPFIVYSILSIEPADTKNATSEVDTSQLETYCVGENYSDVMDVTEAVRAALDRNGGNFNGIPIQSIQYLSADTEFNATRRVYIAQQRFNVRQLRTGLAPSINLIGPNPITVGDGASVSGLVDTINFSPTSVSVSDNTAIVSITQVGQKTEFRQQVIESQYLTGGASEIDINGTTAVNIPFSSRTIQVGDRIVETGSAGSGVIGLLDAGLYEIKLMVTAKSSGHGVAPHFRITLEGQAIFPDGTAYINHQHGVTEDTAVMTSVVEAQANDRITISAFDTSTIDSSISLSYGMLSVRRIN